MAREFTLASAEDGAALRLALSESEHGSVIAPASGAGFTVSAPVYTYMAPSLPEFLDRLSETPASGSREFSWGSLEGDLKLSARLDSLGHVFLTYELRSPDIGSDKWWRFTGRLALEVGGLPHICKQAREFSRAAT